MQRILMPDRVVLPAAVLFDMDGTLLSTEDLWFLSEIELMKSFGIHWTNADHQVCVGGPASRVTDYMIKRIGETIDPVVLMQQAEVSVEKVFARNEISWQPGAKELLDSVTDHEIPTALVTASSSAIVSLVARQIDLSVFDSIITGDDVENPKPHPDPYLQAAGSLGVEVRNCVAIEDSNTGVRSALEAGAYVLCVPSHPILISDDRMRSIPTLTQTKIMDLDIKLWTTERF